MSITVANITKLYGEQHALDDISFSVDAGQIVGFLGPNGAGKTTTMKILTCFIEPNSGDARVRDYSIHKNPREIQRNLGYLPEHNPLYPDMYVHEYLRFVARLYQIPSSKINERIEDVIRRTGLTPEQHKQIGMLSKGYRQRVGLAQALIHDPPVLILDEPTTGLDPNQIVEIRSLIREIGKEKTILFSTHILPEVEAIADRVIIIHKGRIAADENMEALRATANRENVLLVEFEKEKFDFEAFKDVASVLPETSVRFRIVSPADTDLRKQLFEESVRQENPLFLLMKVQKSLEDIFRNLTQ
jgi:ABC-2 type transport system ATP-binding protein